jgi:hypothetical protein
MDQEKGQTEDGASRRSNAEGGIIERKENLRNGVSGFNMRQSKGLRERILFM